MQPKLLCLAFVVALLFVLAEADDYDDDPKERDDDFLLETNRATNVVALDFEPMKKEEVKHRRLKCVPGRTVVHMKSSPHQQKQHDDDDDDDEDGRRTHMNWKEDKTKESCQICTCSLAGHDEYCSGRPARNLNECLMLAKLTEALQSNIPFDHERELSNRIRRYGDLLWHNDEIPYEPKAKCQRGVSYYSNSISAADTDIDLPSDVNSLLDYSNKDVCFYCVCATDGRDVRCVARDPWFCEYYRTIKQPGAMRVDYAKLYKQDRPTYFRTISYRLRRTMDWGLIDMIDIGGDSLCCSHSDGHRRRLHNGVRAKLRLLRKKLPKENLMEKAKNLDDYDDFIVNNDKDIDIHLNQYCNNTCVQNCTFSAQKGLKKPACIPYISEYSDCSEYTDCKGCNQCRCNAEGQWVCYKTRNTCSDDINEIELYDNGNDEDVVGNIMKEWAQKQKEERQRKRPNHRAPLPEKRKRVTESPVLGLDDEDVMKELRQILRGRRSVVFHHTTDELNEDTLKNSNISGTLGVQKVAPRPLGKANRRFGVLDNSTNNPLHIEYKQSSIYNNHITDNKIESAHNIDHYDGLVKEKLHNIINYTQNAKDKELSKLVVNELKRGTETIGDPTAPVTSNITFTPEKDTLTAMAFIAGNLLNKLWNLEKDKADDSVEIDNMKYQKIADLLDLFKEPLTYKQELVLKEALEQLSTAVSKDKEISHISLCETVNKIKEKVVSDDVVKEVNKGEIMQIANGKESAASNALSKLSEVLELIQKYEVAKTNLHEIKHPKNTARIGPETPAVNITKNDTNSLNLFGHILEKITNLLIPNQNSYIKNKIRSQNMLMNSHRVDEGVNKAFNLNLDSRRLTSADKLILDYITKLQNPCSTSNIPEDKSIRYKQSDILLNLSEFFKIKSYSDLLNMVQPKSSTTLLPPTTVEGYESRKSPINFSNTEIENNNTASINEKLKIHLKAIINDLIELQHAKGKDLKSGEINIADALPCIFKMLNQEERPKSTKEYTNTAILNRIKNVLQAVKNDIKESPLSRRSNKNSGPRPKSAVVWERLVKNLDEKPKSTRRFFSIVKPQSYEVVKKLIEYLETNKSNTYKSLALHNDVPASDKLLFLKTLGLDTGSYANVLGKLLILNRENKIPENELEDITDFVDRAIANLELSKKVMNSLNETKKRYNVLSNNNQGIGESIKKTSNDNSQIADEQSLNRVIKNRVKQYLKKKESESATEDLSYDIAQRILSNLENGSDKLARELYKILLETSQREKSTPASKPMIFSEHPLAHKRPIKLEDPSNKQRASEDLFLKTLESAWANLQSV